MVANSKLVPFSYSPTSSDTLNQNSVNAESVYSSVNTFRAPRIVESMHPEYLNSGIINDPNVDFKGVAILFFSDDKKLGIYCSGAFLTKTELIFPAHCAFNSNGTLYYFVHVAEGRRNRYDARLDIWLRPEYVVRIHEWFNITNVYMHYDIGIITLPYAVDSVTPIPLKEYDRSMISSSHYKTLQLVGYGRNGDTLNTHLRYMSVDVASNMTCISVYGPKVCREDVITTYGHMNPDKNICRVESGALLIDLKSFKSQHLVGLAAFVSFMVSAN